MSQKVSDISIVRSASHLRSISEHEQNYDYCSANLSSETKPHILLLIFPILFKLRSVSLFTNYFTRYLAIDGKWLTFHSLSEIMSSGSGYDSATNPSAQEYSAADPSGTSSDPALDASDIGSDSGTNTDGTGSDSGTGSGESDVESADDPSKGPQDIESALKDQWVRAMLDWYEFRPEELLQAEREIRNNCKDVTKCQLVHYLEEVVNLLEVPDRAIQMFQSLVSAHPVTREMIDEFLLRKFRLFAITPSIIGEGIKRMEADNTDTLCEDVQKLCMAHVITPEYSREFVSERSSFEETKANGDGTLAKDAAELEKIVDDPNTDRVVNKPRDLLGKATPKPNNPVESKATKESDPVPPPKPAEKPNTSKDKRTAQDALLEECKQRGISLAQMQIRCRKDKPRTLPFDVDFVASLMRDPKPDMFMSYKIDPRFYPNDECLEKILKHFSGDQSVKAAVRDIRRARMYMFEGNTDDNHEISHGYLKRKRYFGCRTSSDAEEMFDRKVAQFSKTGEVAKGLRDFIVKKGGECCHLKKGTIVTSGLRFDEPCECILKGHPTTLNGSDHSIFYVNTCKEPIDLYVDSVTFQCPVFPLDEALRSHTTCGTWISVFTNCTFEHHLVLHNTTTLCDCQGLDVIILPSVTCMMENCKFRRAYVLSGHLIASKCVFEWVSPYDYQRDNGEKKREYSHARTTLEHCEVLTVYRGLETFPEEKEMGIHHERYFDSKGNMFHWEDEPQVLRKRFEVIEAKLREKGLMQELDPCVGSDFARPIVCSSCANKCVFCKKEKNRGKNELPFPAVMCPKCREQMRICSGCALCGGYLDMQGMTDTVIAEETKGHGKEMSVLPGMQCKDCHESLRCCRCRRIDPYVPYVRT